MNIWVTADQHHLHANILEYCNRKFNSINHMDQVFIDTWNKYVQSRDKVFCLGDFTLSRYEDAIKIIRQLNGFITFIPGSHDNWIREFYTDSKFMIENPIYEYKNKGVLTVMCHYPMVSWRASYHGSYHVFGHTHGKYQPTNRSMDVGVDEAFRLTGEYRPFSLDEIIDILSKRDLNEARL